MSSIQPPVYYFNGINYNSQFFNTSSTSGISQNFANANYLSKVLTTTSTSPSTTFNNLVTVGNTALTQSAGLFDIYDQTNTGSMTVRLNNNLGIPQTILNLNTSGLSTFNGTSTNSSNTNVLPVASGVLYLTGVNNTLQNYYQLNTDSSGHISFATGTNTLQLGTSSSANGNLTCFGPSPSISMPYSTNAAAISCPSATGIDFSLAKVNVNTINFPYIAVPTFTATQIGYSNCIYSSLSNVTVFPGTQAYINLFASGFTFPSVGKYMVSLHFVAVSNATVGYVNYCNLSISTTSGTAYALGSTYNLNGMFCSQTATSFNNSASYLAYTLTEAVIVNTLGTFYPTANSQQSGVGFVLTINQTAASPYYGNCFVAYTRIA